MFRTIERVFRINRPLTFFPSRKLFSTTAVPYNSSMETAINFYNYSVKDIRGKWVHLNEFKGKLTLVAVCNTANENYHTFIKELQKLKDKYSGKGVEVLIIPRYPPKKAGSPVKRFLTDDIETSRNEMFVCKGIPHEYDQNSVNYDALTINAECGDAYNYLSNFREGSNKTIVEDFEKFLIDKNGTVVYRCGNNTPLQDVVPKIEKELSNIE